MSTRPTILVLMRYFTPGWEATGPFQSLRNAILALGDSYRFRALAIAAPGETVGQWQQFHGIDRMALDPGPMGAKGISRALRKTPYDLLWANGFFDQQMTIPTLLLRRFRRLPRRPVLIAPHGEMAHGAITLNGIKKRSYLRLVRFLNLLEGVQVQASDAAEARDVRAALGSTPPVLLGPQLHAIASLPAHPRRASGDPLRIAFLSRIDRMKNLDFALERLIESGISARFDIIGPVTHHDYWEECRKIIARSPERLAIRVVGEIAPDAVVERLGTYDLFLMPTRGENYGHAIVDALVAGTPVLLSDRTPWRGLERRRAGVDLALDRPDQWVEQLRRFAAMSSEALAEWRCGARLLAEEIIDPAADAAALARMFAAALSRNG